MASRIDEDSAGIVRVALLIALALCFASLGARAFGQSLENGSFESGMYMTGIFGEDGYWFGNTAQFVEASMNIQPYEGSRMMHFVDAGYASGGTTASDCTAIQLVDLAPIAGDLGSSMFTATVSARCNRIQLDSETDSQFEITIWCVDGSMTEFPDVWDTGDNVLSSVGTIVLSDSNPTTWEPIVAALTIHPDTDYLAILFDAAENIFNDDVGTEFDGHFGDDVQLFIEEVVVPVNDECANALTVGDGIFAFNTTLAGTDLDQPCGPGTNDVHYRYAASCDGILNANTCISPGPGSVDTVLTVWNTDDCTLAVPGNELGCDDDGCGPNAGFSSETIVPVSAGASYLVTVSGWSGDGASGLLQLECFQAEENDNCADALPATDGDTPFSTVAASVDGPSNCVGSLGPDVWFDYVATATGTLVASTCNAADFDTVVSIYSTIECPVLSGGSELLGCNDDAAGGCGLASIVAVPVTEGDAYKVQIGGFGGARGTGVINLQVFGPPPNDDCDAAVVVTDGDYAFSTLGATTDGPANCDPSFGADVWFDWTASCDGSLVVSTCEQVNYDSGIAVYSTTLCPVQSGFSQFLGCNDDAAGCDGISSVLAVPVSAGLSYKIQVGGFNGAVGLGSVSFACVPRPLNDNCENAERVVGALPVTVEGDASAATDDAEVCGLTGNTPDVHFVRTATFDGVLRADTCLSTDPNLDTTVTIWEAGTSCAEIADGSASGDCGDDACGPGSGFASEADLVVSTGNEYLITVSGWDGVGYAFSLTLSESPIVLPEPCDFPNPGADEMTQSFSQVVTPLNSVSCNSCGGITADNGYYRIFDFGIQGIPGIIEITAVEIGIEVANAGPTLDTQPVGMKIHDHTGVYVTGGAILPGTLTEIGSEVFGLPTLSSLGLQCFAFSSPIVVNTGVVDDIAVEVDIPSAINAGLPISFFIGSNPEGESRQNYLRSFDCAVPDPLPTAEIGFPDMHIVMNVHYNSLGVGFLRGDVDGSGFINPLTDAVFALVHQFGGGPPPPCIEAADVDDNAIFNGLVDAMYLLSYGFLGGSPPPPPFPKCGHDPDLESSLGCLSYLECP